MADPAEQDRFDVGSRFVKINGRGGQKDYLPVQARVDWFRHESPDGIIEQDLVQLDERLAMFKTTVTRIIDGEIKGRADGFGMEFAKDFPDYILKAATVSLGRALNALGYGGSDLDEGIAEGRVADAPVDRSANRQQAPTPITDRKAGQATATPLEGVAPDAEVVSWTVFWKMAKELGVRDMNEYVELTGAKIPENPQHALNRLRKVLRERDAALAGTPS